MAVCAVCIALRTLGFVDKWSCVSQSIGDVIHLFQGALIDHCDLDICSASDQGHFLPPKKIYSRGLTVPYHTLPPASIYPMGAPVRFMDDVRRSVWVASLMWTCGR